MRVTCSIIYLIRLSFNMVLNKCQSILNNNHQQNKLSMIRQRKTQYTPNLVNFNTCSDQSNQKDTNCKQFITKDIKKQFNAHRHISNASNQVIIFTKFNDCFC